MAARPEPWQHPRMTRRLTFQHHWLFCLAAAVEWLALGWPILQRVVTGEPIRGMAVPAFWIIPYLIFGAAAACAMLLRLQPRLHWTLMVVQLLAVLAMTIYVPWAGMSEFLVIIAWQAAMATTPARALGWVGFQTLAIIATLAQALNPDLCWVITKSFAVQLLLVFAAQALRRQADTAETLAATNEELRSAQALIAAAARDTERLRISRELHDAWGHELTALGLQLEIASNVAEPDRARDHVGQARGLARDLLGKVRDVVSGLREDERDLRDALHALAASVPAPAVHVDLAPGLRVGPDQAHALIRCAQEAVTNAVRHAGAANLWLEVRAESGGVRLVARDDGTARAPAAPGSGLTGMRERLEQLGGRLALRTEGGFTVDAWLPARNPSPA